MELINVNGDQAFNCGYCNFYYPRMTYLRQHLQSWTPCCIRFAQDNPTSQGSLSVQLDYPCYGCKISYRSLTVLQNQHFSMDFCPATHAILGRIAATGTEIGYYANSFVILNPAFGQCKYCGIQYSSKEHLEQHYNTWRPCCIKYHGDNPSARGFLPHKVEMPCVPCKLVFGSTPDLTEHEDTKFCRQQRGLPVPADPTAAPSTSTLDNSSQQVQPDSKCVGQATALEQALTRSNNLHGPEQYIITLCNFCGKEFPFVWKEDEQVICTACEENHPNLDKSKDAEVNDVFRRDSVLETAMLPQLPESSQSANSTRG